MESYRMRKKRVEENRSTAKEVTKRGGMEWNRIERKCMSKMIEKAGEHTRRCCRPTGGWAMRTKALISYKGFQV